MITADFYPTIQTEATDVEYTDLIENLDNSVDMFKPYVMGYLPGTYIPDHFFVSAYEATDAAGMENDGVIFRPVYNKAANFPWFFTACRKTSTMDRRAGKLLFLDGAWSDFNNSTSENDYQLLNGFNISLNAFRSFTFSFQYGIYDNTRNTNMRSMTTAANQVTVTTANLIDFLYNDGTVNLTITHNGYTSSSSVLSLHASDFDSGMAHFLLTLHHVNTDQDCEIDIHIIIANFRWTISRIKNEGGSSFGYPNESVAFQWETTDGVHVVSSLNNGYSITSDGYITIRKDSSRIYEIESGIYKKTILDTVYVGCGLDGDIPGSFIRNAPTYSLLLRKNFVVQVIGVTRIAVVPLLMINDLKNTLCFIGVRITETNPPYGFSDDVYVPHYKTDDSPNFDLLNGDLDTIENDLRPWQMYNINNNDFTWDDIPPYVPPGPPGPPEGEESGDRIPNNGRYFSGAYNFITQYAMTRQQLGQFGNLLWTSWADGQGTITDMWKNFKMFISADPASDTGSIDIASVMDFILSLQVFPFDLSSLLHTDSSNVCIGTGQYPLAVSGKKLLTINHILDCGTMAIPRPYSDFRDYENMTITAYLPYCGSVELNPGDVVGRSVGIEYSVDTLSGSCTAVLTVYDDEGYLYNVGMINGQISASIPMTATNSGQIRAQRISDVASLAGLAGNTFLGNIAQGSSINPSGVDSNPIGAISSLATGTVGHSFNSAISAQQMFANRFSRGAISCPTLAGGNGIAAFYQPACPYIQMRYGLYQKPANYDHSVGGVSASSNPLSSYAGSGFTVCENVDISGFTCHEEERSAIKALLESGVYL